MTSPSADKKQDDAQEIKDTIKQIKRSSIILTVLVVAVVILLGALFFAANSQPTPLTFEELYQQTLAGQEGENNFMYNEFVFIYANNFWNTRVTKYDPQSGLQEFDIPFKHNPRELENVFYEPGVRSLLSENDKVYLTFDPLGSSQQSVAGVQLGRVLGKQYNLLNYDVEVAFYAEPTNERALITCNNATQATPVIEFVLANTTQVTADGYCITVAGQTDADIVLAAEKFAMVLVGVFEDEFVTQPPAPVEPLEVFTVGPYTVSIDNLQYFASIGQRLDDVVLQDTPDGIYLVTTLTITNEDNETLEFNPGVFGATYNESEIVIDYQEQRFLPGKLSFINAVDPGSSLSFRYALDLPFPTPTVNLSYDFVGFDQSNVIVAVPIPDEE